MSEAQCIIRPGDGILVHFGHGGLMRPTSATLFFKHEVNAHHRPQNQGPDWIVRWYLR